MDTVSEIYGLHLWSYDPVGIVSAKMGPLMAASDKWQIDIEGVGGHGAVPEV
jgi:metal-dependent amidase/aminoacylase/carboxypeptidase family protein